MKRIGWGVVLAMVLGGSSVALAEDSKPEPGFKLSLEERGPCSLTGCPKLERPRRFGPWRDPFRSMRADDPRRPDYLLRLHYGYRELLRTGQRNVDKLNADLAKDLIAPTPGVEMSLEERGPCSVIECEPMTPRKRELIEREIKIHERLLRNADMRPKGGVLLKLHRLYTELLHAELLELHALRAQAEAACSR